MVFDALAQFLHCLANIPFAILESDQIQYAHAFCHRRKISQGLYDSILRTCTPLNHQPCLTANPMAAHYPAPLCVSGAAALVKTQVESQIKGMPARQPYARQPYGHPPSGAADTSAAAAQFEIYHVHVYLSHPPSSARGPMRVRS